jgi:serine phosphatase RsbU (regulator of sigma subunit)
MRCAELVVAFTDGVTEALNAEEEEFGEERLQDVLARSMHLPVQEVSKRFVQSVSDWMASAPQHDDPTLSSSESCETGDVPGFQACFSDPASLKLTRAK